MVNPGLCMTLCVRARSGRGPASLFTLSVRDRIPGRTSHASETCQGRLWSVCAYPVESQMV